MKKRQFKKLCKKTAEILNFISCDIEGGVYHVWWEERGMDYCEYDNKEAWGWLVGCFEGAVNTFIDPYDEWGGVSWKPDSQIIKPTPKNVFAWAKKQDWI